MSRRQRFRRFAWAVLLANLGVIVWGALVRATGSGAGCGNNWPLCNGQVVPRAPALKTLIEFSHRLTSGIALILVVVMLVLACRLFPRRHRTRRAAAASLALMLSEAAIGAGLVLFKLVAENESVARALFMSTHMANTFLLLAALTLTAHWSAEEYPRGDAPGPLRRGLYGALGASILLGISGAVTALGDTLHPASSLAEALRQDLSPTSSVLIQLRVLHPLMAVAVALLLIHLAGRARRFHRRDRAVKRRATQLSLLVITQLLVGAVNILLLAPVWMQLVHLLLADLVWIALVLLADACWYTPPAAGVARDAMEPQGATSDA